MGNQFLRLFMLVALLGFNQWAAAQIDREAQARQELERRNIDEDELRTRLQEKGVDLDNLENLSSAEALEVQSVIEETIAEMESEAQDTKPAPVDSVTVQPNNVQKKRPDQRQQVLRELDSLKQNTQDTLPGAIYGQHLFKNQRLEVYNQTENVRPPENYIIGVGDELGISIFGLSRKEEILEVNSEGFVQPTRMPRIYVKGFTLAQVRNIVRGRYAQYYRFSDSQFSMSLKYARVINVNIFGEVNNYGGFTLPALNTAFNALVAAGGPTDIGSVRKIRVIRGRESRYLDTYEFINNPEAKPDYFLADNDIIQVPVADFVVEIRGAVNRPFRYELLPGEGLLHLLDFAGGLKKDALRSRLKVLRFVDDQQLLLDVNLSELENNSEDYPLKNGDIVIVDQITVARRNVVNVTGEVDYPGEYELTTNNSLSHLIRKVGLNKKSRKDLAFLRRTNPDSTFSFLKLNLNEIINGSNDVVLRTRDELLVYSLASFTETPQFEVKGAVRNPDVYNYNYSEPVRLFDAILLSGGLNRSAEKYAYVTRIDSSDISKRIYMRVSLDNMEDENSSGNIPIVAGDVITVGSKLGDDIKEYVDVSGAVKTPGRYEFGRGMSLSDALLLANGLSFNAASNRIDVFRVLMEENKPTRTIIATVEVDRDLNIQGNQSFELQPFDQIVVREVPQFEFQQNIEIKGEVLYPGIYSLTGDNERLVSVIKRAGGLSPEAFAQGATLFRVQDSIGYIVVDLETAIDKPKSRDNVLLKAGDVVTIPKQMDLVRVIGFTNAQELYPDKILNENKGIAVPYHAGKNAKYYIDEFAAGISEAGDCSQITVEHANGQIEKVKSYGLFRVYPKVRKGSVIRVGAKIESEEERKRNEEKEDIDWGKVFANSVAQATTILSLILLLQRID